MVDAVREPTWYKTGFTNVDQVIWTTLDSDDSGKPVKFSKHADKTAHFYGTFGTGGTIILEGSNDLRADPDHADHASAEWETLVDPQGNAISKTASGIETVLENPLWIRPRVTAGDGSTSLTCSLVGKKSV